MEVPVVARSQNIWSTRGRSKGVLDAGIIPIQKIHNGVKVSKMIKEKKGLVLKNYLNYLINIIHARLISNPLNRRVN
jgi:hypothetical protein